MHNNLIRTKTVVVLTKAMSMRVHGGDSGPAVIADIEDLDDVQCT